ncbi:MAG: hypothetical protein HY049_06955 [Acidobacteria bacterium]|nr:hypothetical protein [Acidobacteriota bacterium]
MRRLVVRALVIVCSLAPLPAQAVRNDSEFKVNTYVVDDQSTPATAVDLFGNFVVVWQSYGQDGSGLGIFGQRFDASGAPVGGEFQVNTFTTGDQSLPVVAIGPTGNLFVVWNSKGQDGSLGGVFARRYDSNGVALAGEFQVNTYTTAGQYGPSIASDGAGNFVVVWSSFGQDGSQFGVFGQRFDSSGAPQGGEFQVNATTTDYQRSPAVAADSSGNFVVAWESQGQDGSGYGIFGRRFDSTGTPASAEIQINTFTTGDQAVPSIAMDPLGNFVVAWNSYAQDGSDYGVFARRFDSSASPVAGEFQVNTFTTGRQLGTSVGMDTNGGMVVTWRSFDQDGSRFGVFGRPFDAGGVATGPEFQANTFTPNRQTEQSVAMDPLGDFVVAWSSGDQDGSGYGIFAQRFLGSLSCSAGDADADGVCDDFDNCLSTYNPTQDDTDHDGVGDACDVMVTAPAGGTFVDCSIPTAAGPTITWDKGMYDQFKVFISPVSTFPSNNRVSSGSGFLKVTSYTPPAKTWKSVCAKAVKTNAASPILFIHVFAQDLLLKGKSPDRLTFSNLVEVHVKP